MQRDKAAMAAQARVIATSSINLAAACDDWLGSVRGFNTAHKMAIATPAEIMTVEAAARVLAKFEGEAEGRVAAFVGAAQ